ncbi:lymphocyte antigen 75-like [Tubulanus polymorphus]|uniref:lymphocyte antigen 75-like n=1 Tax=Tubulanus polymorphus TaxID=672921 RepID=UPI003DA593AB
MPERCPPGWVMIGQHCVIADFTPQTWLEADKTCADEGAFLVKINDDKQNEDLAQYISDLKNKKNTKFVVNGFWIGAHGQVVSSTSELVYADGSALGFTKWSKPPSAGTANKAVVIDYDGNWSQEKRSHGNGAICQLPISCPGGFSSRRNTCYKIFTTAKNWMESEKTCVKYGGHLLTIVDSEQNEFYKTIAQNYGNSVWIGFNDIEKEGDFVWSSNTDVVYTNWGKYWGSYAQPWTRGKLAGDCVVLSKEGKMKYTWDDISCEMKRAFICEIPHPIQEAAPSGCTSPPLHYNVIQQSQQKRDYGIDESVEVKCAHGGTLVGDVKIICYGKNIWSSLSQSCTFDEKEKRRKDCVLPTDPNFSKFNGTNSITSDGYICQRWDSQKPHSHSQTDKDFPLDGSATAANNFCRPVGGESKPWCYTTNPNIEKQTCDIPVCDIPTCRVPDISNVEIAGGKTIVLAGEEVQMVCKDGYFPEENTGDKLTCTENRAFTGEHRVCRGSSAFSCPIDIPRGSKTNVTGSVWVKDSVEYSCKQYKMYKGGDKRRKCGKPPTLSGKPIICEEMPERCPPGWAVIGQHCVIVDFTPQTWLEADKTCADEGAFLVKINDDKQNEDLAQYISDLKNKMKNQLVINGFWIGAHGQVFSSTSELVYADGSALGFTKWSKPPSAGTANKAVVIDYDGNWSQEKRSKGNGAICQLPISCPGGFSSRRNTCYKIFTTAKNWMESENTCVKYGGHLLTIVDSEQNEFYKTIAQNYGNSVWIGFNDIEKEGDFVWSSNNDVVYTNWGKYWGRYAQPWTRGTLAGDCVVLSKEGKMKYTWDDISCEMKRAFICEIPHPIQEAAPSGCTSPPLHYNVIQQSQQKRDYGIDESVEVKCAHGGTLVGDVKIICYGKNIWSSLSQSCTFDEKEKRRKDCVLPTDPDFSKFNGTNSITSDGYICQRWDSQKPHSHSQTDKDFPLDGSATAANNFCRPVGGEYKPWCYTTNPNIEKQTCDIPVCDIPTCRVPDISNVEIAGGKTIVLAGEEVQMVCKDGYFPEENTGDKLTCTENRVFTGEHRVCRGSSAFSCTIDIPRGSKTNVTGSVWVEDSVEYSCKQYQMYKGGDKRRKCEKPPTLSGKPIICEDMANRCPAGWVVIGDYCMTADITKHDWVDAEELCAQKGGFLAKITDGQMNSNLKAYIKNQVSASSVNGFWIGAHGEVQSLTTSILVFMDSSPITYANWLQAPTGGLANKAVVIDKQGKWILTKRTSETFGAICQLPINCPDGFTARGRMCHKVFTEKKNWNAAETVCSSYGGHLITILDTKTNEFYKSIARKLDSSVWIGLNDITKESIFRWTSGKTFEFSDWGKYWKTYQQPWARGSLSGDCVVLSKEGKMRYRWDDVKCTEERSFICELAHPVAKDSSPSICQYPPLHYNAILQTKKRIFDVGETVRLACRNYGTVMWEKSITCYGNDIWSSLSHRCNYTLEQKLKTCVLPTDPNFSKFNGTNSITSDGYICQRWDSQKPHSHSQTDKDFPLDGSATAADNFCRPVGGESKPWCYTTNPNIEKQTCDIPVCDIPTCQVPSAANITVAENDVIVLEGEKITVRCDKGFHPVDDIMETELTCLGTGNFLGKMIKCLGPDMFQCKIDVLPHSQTSMSGTVWVGKSVNYKCHSYYLYKGGDRVRTCQKESLKLSGTPLICEEDPDRCPPGWALVAERCIIIISNPQSYAAADLACAGKGSFLMTIPNSEIQSEVDSYLSTHTNQNAIGGYWTGGHAEGGKWSWADDVAIAYTNWKVKPSGQIANKAIAVDNTGKWMAVSTNANNMAAICQLPAVACPGGFTDYGSVCYKLFTAMKDFALADETCQMYGGHLASIPDSKTNELYKNVAKDSGQSVWIGANDRATEGDFVWTSGKTLQFTDWGKYWKTYQQPWTSGSLSGDCVVLSKEGWMKYAWDDISCASKEAFICEIPRPTEGSEEICGRPSLHFNIVSNSEKTVFEIGESVKFSCKTGNLVGDQSLVCNGGNIWLGIPPTCH